MSHVKRKNFKISNDTLCTKVTKSKHKMEYKKVGPISRVIASLTGSKSIFIKLNIKEFISYTFNPVSQFYIFLFISSCYR